MTSPRVIGQFSASVPIGPWTQPRRRRSPSRMKISAILGLAKFCDSLANGGKHWLQVDRRARDDFENVTGRGLIIKSLLELALLGLHLVEQPHVLDRDYGLIGKGGH